MIARLFRKIALTALLLPALARGAGADSAPSVPSGRWGLVNIPVACVRALPSHSSELSTQAVAGTPLRLAEKDGEWWAVTLPDGYEGFVNESSVEPLDSAAFDRGRTAPRMVIIADGVTTLRSDTTGYESPASVIAPLTGGAIVEASGEWHGKFTRVALPDGRTGFVPSESVMEIDEWSSRPFSPQLAVETARAMMGAPYLWGGTSSLAPDCSGLVKCAWLANGIIVPRDASQQAEAGMDIPVNQPDLWMPADLLFFTNAAGTRITHVAIYDRNGGFVHSSGRVKPGHIDPAHPDSDGRRVFSVSRFAGCESTPGIIRVANHPWYFIQSSE